MTHKIPNQALLVDSVIFAGISKQHFSSKKKEEKYLLNLFKLFNSVIMKKKLPVIVALVFIVITASAQETEKKETNEEALKGTHRISLVLGHSHLNSGIQQDGKKGWIAVPSWGLDYDYWISNHWAIGLQTDMMIETFEVEDQDKAVIERTEPATIVGAAIFKPREHVSFIAGMGGEFASEGNFALTRLGIESGWEIKNNWEFGISLLFDIKWNEYNTWVFGFGISKLLRKVRKS